MRSRVLSLMCALCLLLGCAFVFAQSAGAQIRVARDQRLKPDAATPDADPIMTSLSLNLCVDGSTAYPCGNPIGSTAYTPGIMLTYGQILDGVVTFSPPTLNTGTITIFKNTDAVCTLRIGIDSMCPANSTIFDVGDYTLSATLTFPAGSPYANSSTGVGPCSPTLPTCDATVSITKDTSTIALSSSEPIAPLGAPVTISATATGGYGAIPTGLVVFNVDGTALAPAALNAVGVASFTTSTLALGTHTITASYAGALDFLPSADAPPFQQQIVPPSTTTTIASSLNPSIVGENVTFTATVAAAPGVTPTGAVTFKDGATTSFATVVLVAKGGQNIAQTTISTLTAGTHNITANYSGDALTSPSVSPALVQQVNYPLNTPPSGYTIVVTPSPVSMIVGGTATLTVTVTPTGGFAGPVALSCSGLPNESACTFDEASIPSGGGSTALFLSTMAPHDCGSAVPYGALNAPKLLRYGGPALAGALLLLFPRRRRLHSLIKGLLALALVCFFAGLSGCGSHCTDFGTYPGGYTFKVNGSASSATPVTTGTAPGTGNTATPNVSTSVALTVNL